MIEGAMVSGPNEVLRFSGHETFACRYAWLPKAYRAIKADPSAFVDEQAAMVDLGIGKNMVRSLRFWVEATGLAEPENRELHLTDFAHAIFGSKGFDPYLEDIRTLWLLHWKLSSRRKGGLFAWRFLLNHWPYPELTRSEALSAFARESAKMGHSHSTITLSQHLDVFLHTYRPTKSANVGIEDSLDGPLVELALLQPVGERKVEGERWESVYSFRREAKPEVSDALFAYCISEFWETFRPGEKSLTLREIALAPCSPGQVFKLPEDDVRVRLERVGGPGRAASFSYQSSAVQGLLSRQRGARAPTLADIYSEVSENA
ncbi:DUF4007 family protein [Bradyrhizobium sp. dw_78]|uniref:DUF4007 family protein n=1 Tax=Bradyrhizobium sp. dw_78 TaxID=2719793 RepID=UPI001BD4CA45|nr:DUF4007 family protein [Bradyrhizobium sp. dw_78]